MKSWAVVDINTLFGDREVMRRFNRRWKARLYLWLVGQPEAFSWYREIEESNV